MKDELVFYRDVPENEHLYPLSTNIAKMEWNDEDWEWPLRVTFFRGGTYEYNVKQIPAFNDATGWGAELTYEDIELDVADVWTLLKQGARWSKTAADTGEYTRGSHGAAFDYLIKRPIAGNKSLYRKVS